MNADSRELWRLVEPYHQLSYRSPEATAAYAAIGLERPEHQYFGSRLAALGPVGTKVAVAVLYGFAPAYVARAVPSVWSVASPESIVAARFDGARSTLRRVLGGSAGRPTESVYGSDGLAAAAALARTAAESADLAGRPMAAAHADAPWPDEPAMALWHACTILREHRGDAHWAATSAEGVDPVECHVLHAADGAMPGALLQRVSGWDDAQWRAATERLAGRGLVHGAGETLGLTAAGHALKLHIERSTDRGAAQPLAVLGAAGVTRLLDTLRPVVRAVVESGAVPTWEMREQLWRDVPPE